MRYILFLFLLISFGSVRSQNNEGIIIYEEKVNLHRNLPPEMMAMKDRIPEFRSNKKQLVFKGQESVYKAYNEEPAKDYDEQRRRRWWGGQNDNNMYYSNYAEGITIDRREFFGREFLINGDHEKKDWKITADQKQVGSYLCQKALLKDSTSTTEVWFTPMIPVSAGPDDYYGLPGMILHIDINDGERMLTALTIELKELEEAIERPDKGKEISREEFEKLREEKMEEMEAEYGGRGRRYMFRRGE